MDKRIKQAPELIILATDAEAVKARFKGWPDLLLPENVLRQSIDDPAQLPLELQAKLRQRGLLQAEGACLRLTIPVYEQQPLEQWQKAIGSMAAPHLLKLRSTVHQLKQDWQSPPEAPSWERVAHSLLVNYLLWSVGGQMLLKLCGVTAATVIAEKPGDTAAIWQGFVRYNQQYGVSYLLGTQHDSSVSVRNLLNRQDVAKAMATLTDDRRVTVSESSARRTLNSLAALANDRADDGSESTAWPVLSARHLRNVKASLLGVGRALQPLLQQVVVEMADQTRADSAHFAQPDIAMVAYGLLVRIIADDWTEAGLLPDRIQPVIGG